jgi:AcrR family transcriptional regulator
VPKLWTQTIEAHRREVRDAILDTTAGLVAAHGLRSVTMAHIAEQTGIGRATLYKYFSDADAILRAWHQRQIDCHLAQLVNVRDQAADASQRLQAVLEAYAFITYHTRRHADPELIAFLHSDEQLAHAREQLHELIRQVIADCARIGEVRDDVTPDELAHYCLHALAAASNLASEAAVRRLVTVTLGGLQLPRRLAHQPLLAERHGRPTPVLPAVAPLPDLDPRANTGPEPTLPHTIDAD